MAHDSAPSMGTSVMMSLFVLYVVSTGSSGGRRCWEHSETRAGSGWRKQRMRTGVTGNSTSKGPEVRVSMEHVCSITPCALAGFGGEVQACWNAASATS